MIKLKDLLSEKITLPIEIGDTVLMGKFKNKKVVVKTITWNEKGDLLINGKSSLRMRIPPKSNLKYEVNERVDFNQMATEIVKKAGLNSKVIFKNTGSNKADYNVDNDTINIKPTSNLKDFLVTVFHEIDHAKDAKKYSKEKYKEKYEQEMNKAVEKGLDPHDGNYFEIKAEKYGRKMAKEFLKKR
jgi:hypothetical protein|tara:strand:- start:416 stop:973 length:558 start_codon:yes stop_codon:yes gene_type:complete